MEIIAPNPRVNGKHSHHIFQKLGCSTIFELVGKRQINENVNTALLEQTTLMTWGHQTHSRGFWLKKKIGEAGKC
jgi:hypothetical protein